MGNQQTFKRISVSLMGMLLCGVFTSCGSTDSEATAIIPRQKTPKERKLARVKRVREDLERWNKRTEDLFSEETPTQKPKPTFGGIELVRVWRRHSVTGVIEVKQEHHGTRKAAMQRLRELTRTDWKHWSPIPAPELAAGLATTYPEFAECPFIMQVSNTPKDWGKSVGKHLACYRTVSALENALAREFVVRFEEDYMLPCKNLESITIDEDGPYIRTLRKRCRALGFTVTPRDKVTTSRELIERRTNNRLHKKRITSSGR